jgi:hypothetical protein
METPWLAIPAIAPRRTGRLRPSTLSNLLAEFRPKIGHGREGDHTGDELLSVTKARLKSLNDENNALGRTGWRGAARKKTPNRPFSVTMSRL